MIATYLVISYVVLSLVTFAFLEVRKRKGNASATNLTSTSNQETSSSITKNTPISCTAMKLIYLLHSGFLDKEILTVRQVFLYLFSEVYFQDSW